MVLVKISIGLVFLAAVVAQALTFTGKFGTKRNFPRWTLPTAVSDRAIRTHFDQLKVTSSSELDSVFPQSSSSSSDGSFPKRSSSAVPLRLEVRIEGLLDRSTICSPLARKDCVMYSAAAVPKGELDPTAVSSKRADFIVCMADAPWVKILIEGADVLCFGMKDGFWHSSEKSLQKAPEYLQEFVGSNTKAQTSQHRDGGEPSKQAQRHGDAMDFEEVALGVGSIITLVGIICRGPGGQLSMQCCPGGCELPESSPKEALLNSVGGKNDSTPQEEPWAGKILACDDPKYLTHKIQVA